jgi:hypothetical protein
VDTDSFGGFLLVAFGLLAVTFIGLAVARKLRESRDAELTDAADGGWRIRSQIPFPPPDPYLRFGILGTATILDAMEGSDEGFPIAYFDAYIDRDVGREHCAIVDLPVEGPTLDPMTPVSERRAPGPKTADVLLLIAGMDVHSAPFTILVHSRQPAAAVHKAALRLAHAIVADAKDAGVQISRIEAPNRGPRILS